MPSRTSVFKRMFGQSPIRPLQQHMEKVCECARILGPFISTVMKEDWKEATELHKDIVKLENEADDMKRATRLHLPKGIFMAVQRSDVLELITRQDMIANDAKDIAGMVLGRKMQFPGEVAQLYLELLKSCLDAVEQAFNAMNELDKVFEVGFTGREVKVVNDMVNELQAIEHDSDKLEIKIRRQLFELESELPPVHVMFLYQILEWTGRLANRAERVGDSLQMLIVR